MGLITTLWNIFLRDYVTDGVPSSGINYPQKLDGRVAAAQVDAAISDIALFASIGVIFSNVAAMNGNLAFAAGTPALVWNDPNPANNGFYVKTGASMVGAWNATGITLPSSFAATLTLIMAAVPWYNTSWALVSCLKAALVADNHFATIENLIPADTTNPVNQQWYGSVCTQAGPLGAFIKATLAFSDGQMTTLFGAARAANF